MGKGKLNGVPPSIERSGHPDEEGVRGQLIEGRAEHVGADAEVFSALGTFASDATGSIF